MDPNIAKLLEDNFDSPDGDEDFDEEGLENELEDLLGGNVPASKPTKKPVNAKKALTPDISKNSYKNVKIKPQPKKPPPPSHDDEDGGGVPALDMDNIQNLINNIDADEGDDDEEIDENDPDLLSELNSVLENPLAPRSKSKPKPESPKLAPEPEPIVPPVQHEIPVKSVEPEPEDKKPSERDQNITKLKNLQIEYKRAALKAKTSGDKNAALTYLRVSKQLDAAINALSSGQDVDMSQVPPSPQDLPIPPPATEEEIPNIPLNRDDAKKLFDAPTSAGTILEALEQRLAKFKSTQEQAKADNNESKVKRLGRIVKQMEKAIKDHKAGKPVNFDELPCPPGFPPIPVENKSAAPAPQPAVPKRPAPTAPQKQTAPVQKSGGEQPTSQDEFQVPPEYQLNQEQASQIFNAPSSAGSVLEALEQRLAKFKSTREQALADNNASKAKRLGRIVTQVEKAIKDYKAGKPVDFEEIPCPPGFPPIPVENKSAPAAPVANEQPKPLATGAKRPPLKKQMSTSASKQLNYLLERQRLFREAAIEAKKRGEIEQAKEYLRFSKGFDRLIEATKSGLPIDPASIPTPPQLKEDFVVVSRNDDDNDSLAASLSKEGGLLDVNLEELYEKLAQDLKSQIEMCIRNQEYFLKMGDIPTSSRFEKYASDSKKDLNMLLIRRKNGDPIPSYRVEERTFSIVVANLDVPLDELHVEVIRAFDFTGTPEIDTFVRADFPFPSERPQWKKTKTFYDSLTPEYNDTLIFQIDRKSRALPRIIKRHPLKLTIFAKGCVLGKICSCFDNINCSGLLRSDNPIGTVQVKLSDLESKCTIHECSSWTQGRKTINGRLEVKVKIREPLLAKQIEEIKEKWIVFT